MSDPVDEKNDGKTYFAPAERLQGDDLRKELEFVGWSPVINEILRSVGGHFAVLNEHRQILAMNDSMREMLEIPDLAEVLGYRPGKALDCVHADEMPAGCGTSLSCRSCGLMLGLMSTIATGKIDERNCAIASMKGGKKRDLYFRVRTSPVTFDEKQFLLVFLQDITYQQRLAVLERSFFHDIGNLLSGLLYTSELISMKASDSGGEMADLAKVLETESRRLSNEIQIQRTLNQSGAFNYQPTYEEVEISRLVQDLRDLFNGNPFSKDKVLSIPSSIPEITVRTDVSLVMRVLGNMLTNAFEETESGGGVKLWVENSEKSVAFCVWNNKVIPPSVSKRIFQRNFSTKSVMGRGNGTYSMKLFGEEILGGTVTFTSDAGEGTVFRFALDL